MAAAIDHRNRENANANGGRAFVAVSSLRLLMNCRRTTDNSKRYGVAVSRRNVCAPGSLLTSTSTTTIPSITSSFVLNVESPPRYFADAEGASDSPEPVQDPVADVPNSAGPPHTEKDAVRRRSAFALYHDSTQPCPGRSDGEPKSSALATVASFTRSNPHGGPSPPPSTSGRGSGRPFSHRHDLRCSCGVACAVRCPLPCFTIRQLDEASRHAVTAPMRNRTVGPRGGSVKRSRGRKGPSLVQPLKALSVDGANVSRTLVQLVGRIVARWESSPAPRRHSGAATTVDPVVDAADGSSQEARHCQYLILFDGSAWLLLRIDLRLIPSMLLPASSSRITDSASTSSLHYHQHRDPPCSLNVVPRGDAHAMLSEDNRPPISARGPGDDDDQSNAPIGLVMEQDDDAEDYHTGTPFQFGAFPALGEYVVAVGVPSAIVASSSPSVPDPLHPVELRCALSNCAMRDPSEVDAAAPGDGGDDDDDDDGLNLRRRCRSVGDGGNDRTAGMIDVAFAEQWEFSPVVRRYCDAEESTLRDADDPFRYRWGQREAAAFAPSKGEKAEWLRRLLRQCRCWLNGRCRVMATSNELTYHMLTTVMCHLRSTVGQRLCNSGPSVKASVAPSRPSTQTPTAAVIRGVVPRTTAILPPEQTATPPPLAMRPSSATMPPPPLIHLSPAATTTPSGWMASPPSFVVRWLQRIIRQRAVDLGIGVRIDDLCDYAMSDITAATFGRHHPGAQSPHDIDSMAGVRTDGGVRGREGGEVEDVACSQRWLRSMSDRDAATNPGTVSRIVHLLLDQGVFFTTTSEDWVSC